MSETLLMDHDLTKLLGDDAESLLSYQCQGIPKQSLHLPGPDVVDRIYAISDLNQIWHGIHTENKHAALIPFVKISCQTKIGITT